MNDYGHYGTCLLLVDLCMCKINGSYCPCPTDRWAFSRWSMCLVTINPFLCPFHIPLLTLSSRNAGYSERWWPLWTNPVKNTDILDVTFLFSENNNWTAVFSITKHTALNHSIFILRVTNFVLFNCAIISIAIAMIKILL